MGSRWLILIVLFFVRTATMTDLGIDYGQLGMLIGLYQLPGVALALPSGLIGRRFDDKQVVIAALAFMAVGGAILGAGQAFAVAVVGRVLSGSGDQTSPW